MSELFGDLA